MNKDICLLGVGRYTEVIIELSQRCGFNVAGLYHYNNDLEGKNVLDIPVIGSHEQLFDEDLQGRNFAVSIGDNYLRASLSEKIRNMGGYTPNLVHPSAEISSYAIMGTGLHIHSKSVIGTKVKIKNDTILSINSIIQHHSTVGKGCFFSTCAIVGASIAIEDFVFCGINSTVMTGVITIGTHSIIGAVANVIRDVEPMSVMVGNPAKLLRKTKREN